MAEAEPKRPRRRIGKVRRALARLRARNRRLRGNDQIMLSVMALLVGAAAGGGALVFRLGIGLVQRVFYGSSEEYLYRIAAELPWWQLLLAPTLGGLLIGLFVRFVMPGRRPLGVADVIEASALRGGHMRLASGMGAAAISAASIGVGASVGREGPVVHLGASLASWLARQLRLSRSQQLTLLGCGVAAAIAASFNVPIAGVLFALEVVVGHYALSAFAPIVISSVVATLISRAYFGAFPAFTMSEHHIVSF